MTMPKPNLAWPADASMADGSTLLTVEEITDIGGGTALRQYVATRLGAVATQDATMPKRWASFAVEHLTDRVSDATDGGVEVSAASLQMALAYMAYLEAVAKGGVA
ncbi:hypothetical protein [uncultured Sphingomonas sp.]|uniref:hypothetical protein n=1 Tax=uncultured Sphingomonas sp. TaxID=158754 RepID=UPI00258DBBD8|nr:hypothetical protein [uncultured Sphingomonas sp.]